MYPYIYFFKTAIPSFHVMVAIGLMAGIIFYDHYSLNKFTIQRADKILVMAVFSLPLGFICAMLFDKAVHREEMLWEYTGMTFLGGLWGGTFLFMILSKSICKTAKDLDVILDCLIPCLLLAHAFGRIGCFLGGCCYGRPALWGVYYPSQSYAFAQYGHTRMIPVPLLESLFLFALFILFVNLIKHHLLMYYCLFYGTFRFLIEFLRGDSRGGFSSESALHPSQWLCILMILFSIGVYTKIKLSRCKGG